MKSNNMLKIYNTLIKRKEIFTPLIKGRAMIYTCGPTVYWFAHIGNLRTYIFEDILKRVLLYNGYELKHVMNITDVGHLTSDADSGEDKMEKGAKKEGKTAWEIAEFYTQAFKRDLMRLNIKEPDIWAKATDTINDQIGFIKILEKKGFTYKITDGIYFDSSKVKDYGKLIGSKRRQSKLRARIEVVGGKKNPTDFSLWKFTPIGVKRQMEWNSPWGKGFPGWHTECVVMATKYLKVPFDLHCGGIDHIPIHHTNEIAQAQAVWDKNLANFWLHGEFLILKENRMGKSEGNSILIEDLIKKGFDPLAYRYLCLTARYRSKLAFTWDDLKAAQNALERLRNIISGFKNQNAESRVKNKESIKYRKVFLEYINDDLDMPKALALIWKIIKEKLLSDSEKYQLILKFDNVLGLRLDKVTDLEISQDIKMLLKKRGNYRQQKEWQKADEVRKKIKELGYYIEDTKEGIKIKRINIKI